MKGILTQKGSKETFWDSENILYLDRDGGYMEVCIYQDSLNYIFNILCILLYVSIASIKLIFFKLIQLTLEPCLSTSVFVFFPPSNYVTIPFTIESSNVELWYRGLTVKWHVNFQMRGGSASLMLSFKAQKPVPATSKIWI